MVYGDLQFFDIVVFAVIAVFLIYRLRSVLGKRTGFQQKTSIEPNKNKTNKESETKTPSLNENEQKLSLIYKKISGFDHKAFLDGAKKAFEIIITAFNSGDKKTLKNLVSKEVYEAFVGAIDKKANNPQSQFYSLEVGGIEDAKIEGKKIIISVKFVSEQIINDNEDSIKKNKDVWTFEKHTNSSSPAWILTST